MTPQRERPEGARILLAEDDDEVRRMLSTALERDGHSVDPVRDGAELVQRLSAPHTLRPDFQAPDVVILDHRMPNLTGLDALSILRRGGWRLPTILITAFGDRRTHDAARRLGAGVVLDKPFELADLRQAVASVLAGEAAPEGPDP